LSPQFNIVQCIPTNLGMEVVVGSSACMYVESTVVLETSGPCKVALGRGAIRQFKSRVHLTLYACTTVLHTPWVECGASLINTILAYSVLISASEELTSRPTHVKDALRSDVRARDARDLISIILHS